MFCANCGKELADDAKFCAWCGTQVMREESEKAPETAVVIPAQKKKNSGKIWGIGAAIVVVLLGVVFVGNGIGKLPQGQEDHGEKTVAGTKADRADDTEVQERKKASGTKKPTVRKAGLYQSDGSFIPWDDLGIDVETDYTFDNYRNEAKSPYHVFYNQNYKGELVLPNNITKIGDCAFVDTPITSIDLSNTQITSIGDYAFPKNLTSIELPDTVTSIGECTFRGCISLTSIDLSNTQITSLGEDAFSSCDFLTSIELPDTVTNIGERAFRGCISLTSIDLSNTQITSIGDFAFPNNLTSIELPDTVTSIGESAFNSCKSLTSIDLSNTQITSIGYMVFIGCESLTSIELPDTVTSIGESAFSGCESLTSIELPDTVTSIGESAFSRCNFTSIDLSNTQITSLSRNAFGGCESLTSIDLPNTLTVIEVGAFYNCKSLINIDLSNTQITDIETNSFSGCTSLTSIVLPDTLTSIGWEVFEYCSSSMNINFVGTMEEWNAIDIVGDLNWDFGIETITCSDGVITL